MCFVCLDGANTNQSGNFTKNSDLISISFEEEEDVTTAVTEREREAETQAEGEAGSMHREPDVGFDPGSPGSCPGPKAGAKPLRHPGIPQPCLLNVDRVDQNTSPVRRLAGTDGAVPNCSRGSANEYAGLMVLVAALKVEAGLERRVTGAWTDLWSASAGDQRPGGEKGVHCAWTHLPQGCQGREVPEGAQHVQRQLFETSQPRCQTCGVNTAPISWSTGIGPKGLLARMIWCALIRVSLGDHISVSLELNIYVGIQMSNIRDVLRIKGDNVTPLARSKENWQKGRCLLLSWERKDKTPLLPV
ncbi:uncharacterized protein [Vulpes vulpes]|uniref:Uncharacterized protein isoform X2 n=1 Tax=Vulpes vulpes TaxID=9627 RepID=A0ABM5ACA8_VULVU